MSTICKNLWAESPCRSGEPSISCGWDMFWLDILFGWKHWGASWNLHVSIIKPDQYYLCFMLVAWAWRCDGFHLQTPFSCWDMIFFSFTVLCRVVYTIVWFILFLISTRYVKYAAEVLSGMSVTSELIFWNGIYSNFGFAILDLRL